jgi:hypothetical protein
MEDADDDDDCNITEESICFSSYVGSYGMTRPTVLGGGAPYVCAYRTFDLNSPPPNWGKFTATPGGWANQYYLFLFSEV